MRACALKATLRPGTFQQCKQRSSSRRICTAHLYRMLANSPHREELNPLYANAPQTCRVSSIALQHLFPNGTTHRPETDRRDQRYANTRTETRHTLSYRPFPSLEVVQEEVGIAALQRNQQRRGNHLVALILTIGPISPPHSCPVIFFPYLPSRRNASLGRSGGKRRIGAATVIIVLHAFFALF